jgi:AcrR family transcriptional regulator
MRDMGPATGTSVKYQTPLRQAQRELTRSRIKDAARNLFYAKHFDMTTMDEIAMAAGLRRSTLYLHYKDKTEILSDIVADYIPKAKAMLATLPSARPTLDEVRHWIDANYRFVAREQVPFAILLDLRANRADAIDLNQLTLELMSGIGEVVPAFRRAVADDADPMQRARALQLYLLITFACRVYLEAPDDPHSKAMCEIAAQDFHAYLSAQP